MQTRDIVVVGASAGGITAIKNLIGSLKDDFKGTIFIVLHVPPYSETQLPQILSNVGPLKAVLAKNGEEFQSGMIYVAPNDHHMLLEEGKISVQKGPKENRFRPSIDALFRSAAYVYGSRVIGVILSGLLDDGVSGLWTIKQQGGLVLIQTPDDAEQPQLPINVLDYVEPDYKLSAIDMGPLISGLITEPAPERFKISERGLKLLSMEVVIAAKDNSFEMGIMDMGQLTPFTCPECHGTLVRLVEGNIIRFRCHTGHAYTASSLLAEVSESVEKLLWQSVRALEEMNMLQMNIAEHFDKMNNLASANLFREKAQECAKNALIIHDFVFHQKVYSEDIRLNRGGNLAKEL